ncbi:MAG: Pantoate kinase [Candidatus Methanofastidiosum methylothiophilum]|uniref:Pantoate kinase n=1 Tax=Candidatus Methanofastidiosum methylothiophilum TaxID=1705564 RepID=A0A150IMD2_9EURY|nr:MAG: Pantoate kinase [Candidatus Methanofastidiosum methylthiophilus]KYC48438.1 MAG: Pantoate kinase [Candidatus Methanofastidiosum methylthiophilus]KYC51050.1 MAG: Pantoate kinase [Candidatus Methanofastidiosum methylthiophilus]
MYSSEYYVPSHITGFFVPFFSDDCFKTGSTGAGVSLSLGLKTKIKVTNGCGLVNIKLNGTELNLVDVPISLNCIHIIKERYPSFFTNKDILIEHECDVPIESGFGASASATLGITFSIKDLINISTEECVRIAHETEVINLSGLGDVIAEVKGGVEIRKTPGIDGIIENIPSNRLKVLSISLGKKNTESVLKDPKKVKIIEKCGSKLLDKLISEPNVEKLMECSKTFTYKTGLMSKEVLDLMEFISEINNFEASGIMIGDGVFTFISEEDQDRILERVMGIKGDIIVSPIAKGLL